MAILLRIPRKFYFPLASASLLMLFSLCALFFDVPLSNKATSSEVGARNESTVLGEFLQLLRIFGVADTVVLLGLCLGICGKRRLLMRILFSLLIVAAIVHPLKYVVGRERPNTRNHRSFPSGDTATAFVLPEVFSSTPVLSTAAVAVAAVVASSRVFYGEHYPSDVLAGAAVGIVAGMLGCWLTGLILRRFRWLPSQQHILWAMVIFLGVEFLNAIFNGYHRHIIQFITWFGPAMAFYICHYRLRKIYGKKSRDVFSGGNPELYFMVKRAFVGCLAIGILLMVIPWFAGSSGLRAPAFSAGLLLMLFAFFERRQLRCGRIRAVVADGAALLYIGQIYATGYLLDIL